MFGQTEGCPIACLVPEDHLPAMRSPGPARAVGRAAPGIELRMENPDGNGVGEVLAKGDHLFKLAEDGWLHTSDLATMDAEGYVYLVGRWVTGSSAAARTCIRRRWRMCCASTRRCSRSR